MSETYTISFLPLSMIKASEIPKFDNGKSGYQTNVEQDYANSPASHPYTRKDLVFHTTDYTDSAYRSISVTDTDGILQDNPTSGSQTLTNALTVNGTTYPAGSEVHTGYRLDLDTNNDGVADLSVYSINVGGGANSRTVGFASTQQIAPNTAFRVVGGANSATGMDGGDLRNPGALYCFAAGTMIAIPEGRLAAVETLAIGDLVMTAEGEAVPVRWIGRQTVMKAFTPRDRFEPVRISAHAIAPGVPFADLVLTADHALILDGLAINAGALVNGGSVAFVPREALPSRVCYFHVETERHEAILANGVPAETFLDQGDRAKFDNYPEYLALYGQDRVLAEMPLPRIGSARMVPPSLRARLAKASESIDYATTA